MSAVDASGCVLVPLERLRTLEALEADIPNLLAKAKEEAHAERLAALRARDAANPDAHTKRTMDWYNKNKEEINARRREAYRTKKETTKTASAE